MRSKLGLIPGIYSLKDSWKVNLVALNYFLFAVMRLPFVFMDSDVSILI